jgi:HSP20 family protein
METPFESLLEITRLQSEINRLFDMFLASQKEGTDELSSRWIPNVDIVDTGEDLVIHIEAPGIAAENLSLKITGNRIVVTGEKPCSFERGKEKAKFICVERAYGKFHRSLYINCPINSHKADAVLKGGVLTVTVPKIKDRRGEEVEIKVVTGPDEEEK